MTTPPERDHPAALAAEAVYAAALAVRRRNCRPCRADLRECACTPEIDEIAAAATALEAARPFMAKAERAAQLEEDAKLADDLGAVYPVTRVDTYGGEYEVGRPFGELLREQEGTT